MKNHIPKSPKYSKNQTKFFKDSSKASFDLPPFSDLPTSPSPASTRSFNEPKSDLVQSPIPQKSSTRISLQSQSARECPTLPTDPFELTTSDQLPSLAWCANCKAERPFEIEYHPSSKTLFSSICIFASGGILGCFLMPYCISSCKEPKRKCRRCDHFLNT